MENSIFERTKNISLRQGYSNVYEYMNRSLAGIINGQYNVSFWELLDSCMESWKYRQSATSIKQYFEQLHINKWQYPEDMSDQDILYAFEMFLNLMLRARDMANSLFCGQYKYIELTEKHRNVTEESIKCILEQNGMTYTYVEDKIVLRKISVSVDASLHIEEDLDNLLLGYYDIRNLGDATYKKMTLSRIANVLEKRRSEFNRDGIKQISDTVFFALNNMNIRHGKTQIGLSEDDELKVLDRVFEMAIFLMQYMKIIPYKNMIDSYKNMKSNN